MVAFYCPSAALAFPRQEPCGTFRPVGAQFEGDSLMAVMKSHRGSGVCCSLRVPAEAETSLRHTSITLKHKTPFAYLFICSQQM